MLLLAGCATTPRRPLAGVIFDKPADVVRQSAEHALTVHGFEVTRNDPDYLQGHRAWSMGVVFTSGGETVGIWIEPLTPARTRVAVSTRKRGMTQRTWDKDILTAMERELGPRR